MKYECFCSSAKLLQLLNKLVVSIFHTYGDTHFIFSMEDTHFIFTMERH